MARCPRPRCISNARFLSLFHGLRFREATQMNRRLDAVFLKAVPFILPRIQESLPGPAPYSGPGLKLCSSLPWKALRSATNSFWISKCPTGKSIPSTKLTSLLDINSEISHHLVSSLLHLGKCCKISSKVSKLSLSGELPLWKVDVLHLKFGVGHNALPI